MNSVGKEFGRERLLETVRAHLQLPAEGLLEAVVKAVREFSGPEQADDITLVVVRRKQI
jgi:serine phosphatase RsbU (regulator of sigma subunit)